MREKLFEIIDRVQQNCAHEGTYCCDCDYNGYDSNSCWKYKIVDAIIESDLLKDDKVYKYVNGNYCEKCGHFLSFRGYDYCPTCGCKLKETNND